MKESIVRVDRAGRLVLPKRLRDMFGLRAGSRLELDARGDHLRLRPLDQEPALVKEGGWWVHRGSADEPLEDALREHRAQRIVKLR